MAEDRADKGAPDRAELFAALSVVEDLLEGGLAFNKPSLEFLESLRALDESPQGRPRDEEPELGSDHLDSDASGYHRAAVALEALKTKALACEACRLAGTRRSVVFGEGLPTPLVLVVGEGPGAEEDEQGLPFVGASGKLLDKMLAAIGLSRRENCYIANIVKCRPPNNREPQPDERASCLPFLREQIAILRPRAILCAGRTAAQTLLDTTEGINRLRLRTHELDGVPLVATYHPSALLRDESLKRPAWEDLKVLRDIIAASKDAR